MGEWKTNYKLEKLKYRRSITRDIAETPSKAYMRFDTRPSPLWYTTWIAVALNDPSGAEPIFSNKDAEATSKKPKRVNRQMSPRI